MNESSNSHGKWHPPPEIIIIDFPDTYVGMYLVRFVPHGRVVCVCVIGENNSTHVEKWTVAREAEEAAEWKRMRRMD